MESAIPGGSVQYPQSHQLCGTNAVPLFRHQPQHFGRDHYPDGIHFTPDPVCAEAQFLNGDIQCPDGQWPGSGGLCACGTELLSQLDGPSPWWSPACFAGQRIMKIDIFPHILPRTFHSQMCALSERAGFMIQRTADIPAMLDVEERFRIMDRFPGYKQVLPLPGPPLEVLGNEKTSPELARMANDGMAELVEKYPDRFV